MQVFIQDYTHDRFLGAGSWVPTLDCALKFDSFGDALEYLRQHGQQNWRVVSCATAEEERAEKRAHQGKRHPRGIKPPPVASFSGLARSGWYR